MMQLNRLFLTTFLITSVSSISHAAPSKATKTTDPLSKEALLVELTGKDFRKSNDISLYSEMVSAYDANNEIAFKSRLQSLLSRFPTSPYADNALYLAGSMAVNKGNYSEAIKYFADIEKKYPRSNKMVAAKFAKAMTYKAMNLPEYAKSNLKDLIKKYPGSPESFRASTELKILR